MCHAIQSIPIIINKAQSFQGVTITMAQMLVTGKPKQHYENIRRKQRLTFSVLLWRPAPRMRHPRAKTSK